MPGNSFQEVTMGIGVISYNGVPVGYLKGDVTYQYNYDIEQFKTGVPLILRGIQAKEITSDLKAGIAQLSAENIAMALGGLPVQQSGGTVATVVNEARAFSSSYGGYGMDALQLANGNVTAITSLHALWTTALVADCPPAQPNIVVPADFGSWVSVGDTVVVAGGSGAEVTATHTISSITPGITYTLVTNSNFAVDHPIGSTVTVTKGPFVNNVDYLLLPTPGVILIHPGSAIKSGVKTPMLVDYSYNTGILKTINLGLTFALAQLPLVFTHIRPNTGKMVRVTMPKAQIDGKAGLKFAESAWNINEVTFSAIYDDSTPAYPMGKIEFET